MTIPATSKKSKSKKKSTQPLSALEQLKETMQAEIVGKPAKAAAKPSPKTPPPAKQAPKKPVKIEAKPPVPVKEAAQPKPPSIQPEPSKMTEKTPAQPSLNPFQAISDAFEAMKKNQSIAGAVHSPDPSEWTALILRLADRTHHALKAFIERNRSMAEKIKTFDPAHLSEAFIEMAERLNKSPEKTVDAHLNFMQDYIKLLQNTIARSSGQMTEPVIAPQAGDKRFQDPSWQEIWLFDFIKQSYLLMARWAQTLVAHTEGLDPKIMRKIDFYTRQMVDAMAPSNFWMTNPSVLRTTMETGGENLIKGLENLLDDIERGQGQLLISMTTPGSFRFGDNIALTPGKVIYQNELIQLIQYTPTTEKVHKTPLLIVPPWINKYYILDLGKKNSLIKYLVDQGHTVFCISWVNPDHRHGKITFGDYMMTGPMAALREVGKATGEKSVNLMAYCIGGTLLATMLAWLKANGKKEIEGGPVPDVASATFLTTLLDFSEPGDLGVFIDEDQIKMIEDLMADQGYMAAAMMATTFNMLRANDLIWSFVVNNYLMGKEPFPFDLLAWNADSTNLPAAMQSFYLRNMYLENNLVKPNKLTIKDNPIDLRNVTAPVCFVSTREDHIAPWKSTYAGTQLFQGPINFILSGSGHIAGVINPPDKNKYGYWTNTECPANPDDFLKTAEAHSGSWWPEWQNWVKPYAGESVPARTPGEKTQIIEDAPGSYVRTRVI